MSRLDHPQLSSTLANEHFSGTFWQRDSGLGQEIVLRNDSGHPLIVFSMANRTEFAAQGLAGGHAGALREHRLNGVPVDPKGRLELASGDRLTLLEAGGGGIGDPADRPAAAVDADVRAFYVSQSEAAKLYPKKLQ